MRSVFYIFSFSVERPFFMKKNEVGTELVDEINGKEVPWNEKKKKNRYFSNIIKPLLFEEYDEERARDRFDRIYNCADNLVHVEDVNGNMKLYQTFFCKNRFCPMCQYRRSLKNSFYLHSVLNECQKKYKSSRFIFLTLTLSDLGIYDVETVKDRISELNVAFKRFYRKSKVKKFLLGYFKKFEITVHKDSVSSTGFRFHIHLHVLLVVRGRYFVDKNLYLNHDAWVKLWQECTKVKYFPEVNVQAIRAKKNIEKAICELSKYTTKDVDYLGFNDSDNRVILKILINSMKGMREIAYGGVCKKVKAQLKIDENDLVHITEKESGIKKIRFVFSKWINGKKKFYVCKKTDFCEVNLDDERIKKIEDRWAKEIVKQRH